MQKYITTVLVLVIFAFSGVIMYLIYAQNQERNALRDEIVVMKDNRQEDTISKYQEDSIGEGETGKNENAVDSQESSIKGWKTYKNDELGISFEYPNEWGEVVRKEGFDPTKGEYKHFGFSLYENFYLGGFHSDYMETDRGGSLLDYDGFIPDMSLGREDTENGRILWSHGGYKVSRSGDCAYTIALNWFNTTAYHAVCNLDRNFMTGFNFAHGGNPNPTTLDPDIFIKIMESVKVW